MDRTVKTIVEMTEAVKQVYAGIEQITQANMTLCECLAQLTLDLAEGCGADALPEHEDAIRAMRKIVKAAKTRH